MDGRTDPLSVPGTISHISLSLSDSSNSSSSSSPSCSPLVSLRSFMLPTPSLLLPSTCASSSLHLRLIQTTSCSILPFLYPFVPPLVMYRLVTFSVLCLTITVSSVSCDECNKAVCASIVSKCQLLERCNCERSNSTCLSDCFRCLDYLYMECCSCVSICPKSNDTLGSHMMQSHAEDLPEPMPSLFAILTEQEDQLLRWTTHTTAQQVSFVTISGADVTENTFAAGTKVTLKDDGLDEEENVQVNSYQDYCT